jgi:putative endonuclease
MILTEKNRFYTGIATDVERRFIEHLCDPKKGAKFFRSDRPIMIVFCEEYSDRSSASKREAAIKKMDRQKKQILIHAATFNN